MQRPTVLPIDHWSLTDVGYSRMRVTSPYAMRDGSFHAALDIGNARLGDVLTATGQGVVVAVGFLSYPWSEPKPTDSQWAGWGNPFSRRPSLWEGPTWGGRMIVLRVSGLYVLYAHCETTTVSAGQTVFAGQRIGTVGESGSAYHAGHVHFGVVDASAAQLEALRSRRAPIPRSMTINPWPLIAASAGSSGELPDTSIPEEPLPVWNDYVAAVPPFYAYVEAGTILYKGPGREFPEHYRPPTGARYLVTAVVNLPDNAGQWYEARQSSSSVGVFYLANSNIAKRDAVSAPTDGRLAVAEQTIADLKGKISRAKLELA